MVQESVPNRAWTEPRLSPDIQPTLYNLLLHPNLEAGTFKGKVTINIKVKSKQETVSVHIKELKVLKTEITLDNAQHTKMKVQQAFEYEPNEFWVIALEEELPTGNYRVYLEFEGKLTNKIIGFYRSSYPDPSDSKKTRHIATTKFEPTFARQAFPCFDEPNFKARYDIRLVKPASEEYIALSNMNRTGQEFNTPSEGLTTVKFSTSYPMSTYLACFIICDFYNLESVYAEKGYPITVYARRDQVANVRFARDVAKAVVDYYTDYFNVDYPLPKLDLIAIPDFVSGAMENWGLITFREVRLLCPSNASVSNRLAVGLTVSHEIAHMWFGDLVTMKWWNDLWLNEGFATFAEYKAAAKVFPNWELDNIFVAQELYSVLKLDSTFNSHPIVQPVSHPNQITEIFDVISYNKGASILRMLESTLGEDNFRNGVTTYMNKFKYNNAETQDLWNHLNEFSGDINVTTFMDTWTRQMGFPVISVKMKSSSITFTQKRFLIDSTAVQNETESPYLYRWEIPITFITSDDPNTVQKTWMKKTDDELVVDLTTSVVWVKVNYHNIGYYIVNYDSLVWDRLKSVLQTNHCLLDPPDRSSVLNDAFSLAEAGTIPYDTALELTKYLSKEFHHTPWSVAYSNFISLHKRLYGTTAMQPFLKYVRMLLSEFTFVKSWDISSRGIYPETTFQVNLLHLACIVGHESSLRQALTLFRQFLSEPAMKPDSELSSIIYYFGIQKAEVEEWNNMWRVFLAEKNPQDKMRVMRALGASTDPRNINKLLNDGMNETIVRSQDYLTLIASTSQNPIASPLVWDFVRRNWQTLVKRYTINDRYLGNLIYEITSNFATEHRINEMKEFFELYPDAGAGAAARKRALERVENNLKWRQKYVGPLTNWFQNVFQEM